MPNNPDLQSNSCAYCLKPVTDAFICNQCMQDKNVSVEARGAVGKAVLDQTIAETLSGDEIKNRKPGFDRAHRKEWKRITLHPDFQKVGSRANLTTFALVLPVAVVGFGVSSMFGFPEILAQCAGGGLAIGWIIYRTEQVSWYHYATWVFKHGQTIACAVDLVSSGELDEPYIVVKDENRLTAMYDTRAFKVVSGDAKQLLEERNAPGSKSTFECVVSFEKQRQEDAVIFEIAESRLWCKPHLSRGF